MWSLTRGGRLREVVADERRSLTRSGRLQEVVAQGNSTAYIKVGRLKASARRRRQQRLPF